MSTNANFTLFTGLPITSLKVLVNADDDDGGDGVFC